MDRRRTYHKGTGGIYTLLVTLAALLGPGEGQVPGCYPGCTCEYVQPDLLYVTCNSMRTFPTSFPSATRGISVSCLDKPGIPSGAFRGLRALVTLQISGDVGAIRSGAFDDITGDAPNGNGDMVFVGSYGRVESGAFRNVKDFVLFSFSYAILADIERYAFRDISVQKFQFYSSMVGDVATLAFDDVYNVAEFHVWTSAVDRLNPCAFGGLRDGGEFYWHYSSAKECRKYGMTGGIYGMDKVRIYGATIPSFDAYGFAGAHAIERTDLGENNLEVTPVLHDSTVNSGNIRERCLYLAQQQSGGATTTTTTTTTTRPTTTTTTTTTTSRPPTTTTTTQRSSTLRFTVPPSTVKATTRPTTTPPSTTTIATSRVPSKPSSVVITYTPSTPGATSPANTPSTPSTTTTSGGQPTNKPVTNPPGGSTTTTTQVRAGASSSPTTPSAVPTNTPTASPPVQPQTPTASTPPVNTDSGVPTTTSSKLPGASGGDTRVSQRSNSLSSGNDGGGGSRTTSPGQLPGNTTTTRPGGPEAGAATDDDKGAYKIGFFEIILFVVIGIMFVIIIILIVAVIVCRKRKMKEYQVDPVVNGMSYSRPPSAITVQPVRPVNRAKPVFTSYDYYGNNSASETDGADVDDVMRPRPKIHRQRERSSRITREGRPPSGKRGT